MRYQLLDAMAIPRPQELVEIFPLLPVFLVLGLMALTGWLLWRMKRKRK